MSVSSTILSGAPVRNQLWANPEPTIIPQQKTAASPSPSPLRKNWRPGQPPPSAKQRPANTIPKKFHGWFMCEIGIASQPNFAAPVQRFTAKAAPRKATTPVSKW